MRSFLAMSPAVFLTGARSPGPVRCACLQVLVRPGGCTGMDDETLQAIVQGAIEAQEAGEVHFSWQGAEPMEQGLDFFRRALALQHAHAPGRTVRNTLHTGGTLIDDAWAAFLAAAGFAVTLHVDGPPGLLAAQPGARDDRLLHGIGRLQAHGVEFQACTAVSALNAHHPLAVYRYLKEIGARQMQFVPLVEQSEDCGGPRRAPRDVELSRRTVGSIAYGRFLTSVFGEWVRHDVGRVFVHLFDSTLQAWVHGRASLCSFAETCERKLAIEHDGSVYACERYLDAGHRLGSLEEASLPDLLAAREQRAFEEAKRDTLPSQCRRCDVLAACRGGCPRHRFPNAAAGGAAVNYLCAGYRHFFRTVAPHMRAMGVLLRQGRPASDIMRFSPR
ncbi:SPASM domain-containing protein [Ramlibacter sp. AN1133]|uniref:SPASM domain-containing protein n=1 Tax=Ramlibacter sp. AN1133 TaxID=3133429 RepID=UPI0030C567E9